MNVSEMYPYPAASLQPTELTMSMAAASMPPSRPVDAHKGTMGHALLVAGSQGMAGAAILASRGCLHSGVGKLTLHTPSANNTILQCTVPEAILHLDEDEKRVTTTVDLSPYKAIGIGPGLGTDEATARAVHGYMTACKEAGIPLVLDADALNIIAQHPDWANDLPEDTIITPHAAEFQRLTVKCESRKEQIAMAKHYAGKHDIIVILKGHPTVVSIHGDLFSCPYGNSGMATPGSGDVLTGILTGLLAQGYTPVRAALFGPWLHAIAGDCAAEELGEEYMLASDIVTHMSEAYKRLKNCRKHKDNN